MTVEELKTKKDTLEQEIGKLVTAFETETTVCMVRHISIDRSSDSADVNVSVDFE